MPARKAKRKEAWLNPGTLSPNPWDLSLSGQNVWLYTGDTRTEDKAPQGCECAGINRHVVGDERALRKRSSDSISTLSLAWCVARRTAKRR